MTTLTEIQTTKSIESATTADISNQTKSESKNKLENKPENKQYLMLKSFQSKPVERSIMVNKGDVCELKVYNFPKPSQYHLLGLTAEQARCVDHVIYPPPGKNSTVMGKIISINNSEDSGTTARVQYNGNNIWISCISCHPVSTLLSNATQNQSVIPLKFTFSSSKSDMYVIPIDNFEYTHKVIASCLDEPLHDLATVLIQLIAEYVVPSQGQSLVGSVICMMDQVESLMWDGPILTPLLMIPRVQFPVNQSFRVSWKGDSSKENSQIRCFLNGDTLRLYSLWNNVNGLETSTHTCKREHWDDFITFSCTLPGKPKSNDTKINSSLVTSASVAVSAATQRASAACPKWPNRDQWVVNTCLPSPRAIASFDVHPIEIQTNEYETNENNEKSKVAGIGKNKIHLYIIRRDKLGQVIDERIYIVTTDVYQMLDFRLELFAPSSDENPLKMEWIAPQVLPLVLPLVLPPV